VSITDIAFSPSTPSLGGGSFSGTFGSSGYGYSAPKSGGIGDFLSQVGTGFLTGAAQGFLGAAGGGQSAPSGGGSSQQDPYSAAAKAFLEKELKERMMMSNLASQATSAFS